MMEHKPAAEPREEAPPSREEPTLSGYREYAAVMSGNDPAAKLRLEEQHQEVSRGAKPAIVEYDKLYRDELRLRDHGPGDTYLARMRSFIGNVRDHQLPRLNDTRDRKAAVWQIKSGYEQWGYERKELHARQRAAFERNVERAAQQQCEESDGSKGADTLAFHVRQEVIGRYVRQHEELNARLQQDIRGYIDAAVERQTERNRQSARSESAPLDEIIRRPREPTPARARDSGRER
jgi:hypothetical protein